jgi:hypothetical protein
MPRVTNVDFPLIVAGISNHLSMFWILSYSVNIVCVYYKIRVFCNDSFFDNDHDMKLVQPTAYFALSRQDLLKSYL